MLKTLYWQTSWVYPSQGTPTQIIPQKHICLKVQLGIVLGTLHPTILAPLNGFEWHMSIDFPTISTTMCHSVWCGRVCLRMCFRSFFPDIRQLHMPFPQGRRGPWGYNHFEPRSSCLQGFEGAGGHFCMFFSNFCGHFMGVLRSISGYPRLLPLNHMTLYTIYT